MIQQYLDASIMHARERARILKSKIPNPETSPEFHSLQVLCEERIDEAIRRLHYLLNDPLINREELAREKLRFYRRTLDDLDRLETRGIAALTRVHKDDVFMNRLVTEIHREIKYPLSPPTVSCLSQRYYWIDPSLRLLVVPPAESESLLHLPDLYHEMAHMLVVAENNPKVEGFQYQLASLYRAIDKYFDAEMIDLLRSTGPKGSFQFELENVRKSWVDWATELFCDLYAVYTVGPAYAWSHFHLCAATSANPPVVFSDRVTSHPPDQARMEVLLSALNSIGYEDTATLIQARWQELLVLCNSRIDNSYHKACPRELLGYAVKCALAGTSTIGSRVAGKDTSDRIFKVLNHAWEVFWASPSKYAAWERTQIDGIRKELSS